MTGRIWAIALNTFREAVRIRVLYGILVLVVGANLMTLLTQNYDVSLMTVAVFSAIMIAIQWSDLEKAPDPV